MKNTYELVCGLETHAELKTNSKMFCGCKNDPFGAKEPNTHTCPVCLGMPGALPVANHQAILWTIKLGLALNCKINLFSKFDRKNYFYPDLPKAYQISQYDLPFCYDGEVQTTFGPVGITRIHLEEDTGKLLHQTINGEELSLIDFNRSSVPLIEIVTEPDITSPAQAKEYAKNLRDIIRFLEIGDCDMEQGGMRLEANISLRTNGEPGLPKYKTEVKNINSFRFMEQAIKFEMDRQAEILETGVTPPQETRGWDAKKSETFSQRTKEDAADYRYFPDPDLAPIRFSAAEIETLRAELPELPEALTARWQSEFGVNPKYSQLLFNLPSEAQWLEELFKAAREAKVNVDGLANALANKKISFKMGEAASEVLQKFQSLTGTDEVADEEIITTIKQVLAANPGELARYQAGQTQLFNFFFGQTIKALGKKVNPETLRNLIKQAIG